MEDDLDMDVELSQKTVVAEPEVKERKIFAEDMDEDDCTTPEERPSSSESLLSTGNKSTFSSTSEEDFVPVYKRKVLKRKIGNALCQQPLRNPYIDDEAAVSGEDNGDEPSSGSNLSDFVASSTSSVGSCVSSSEGGPRLQQLTPDIYKDICAKDWDDKNDEEYEKNSFCDDEIEYEEIGVYTQSMLDAARAIEEEMGSGKDQGGGDGKRPRME